MRVRVSAKIYPSEDIEKVKKAVKNLFPTINLEILEKEKLLVGEGDKEAINHFRYLLHKEKILDAARKVIKSATKREGDLYHSQFDVNKQVAFVGKISFSTEGESPLGPITIEITSKEEFIDWLAPRTIDGKPVK
ncbi:MAG: RNA-binding domain-containing protein [Candidatus Hydrothermarchaeota archaeon]